ncbi:hypothetical protein GCM10028811_16060 [Uliginosibacterium sediminicola]
MLGVLMAAGVQLPRYLATVKLAATAALSCGRVAVEAGALVAADEAELEALEELDELAAALDLLEAAAELLDFDELLLATLDDVLEEALDEALAVGPTEHQALLVKLLLGNSAVLQVKEPLSVV